MLINHDNYRSTVNPIIYVCKTYNSNKTRHPFVHFYHKVLLSESRGVQVQWSFGEGSVTPLTSVQIVTESTHNPHSFYLTHHLNFIINLWIVEEATVSAEDPCRHEESMLTLPNRSLAMA